MELEEYKEDKPIGYYFKTCPVYEFAKNHDLLHILLVLCNIDYKGMEVMHSKLIRKFTLKTSSICEYIVVGDKDEYIKEHEEYIDSDRGIYNKYINN